MDGHAGGLALSGIRVLDLSRLLPGGYCTLLLADLGADVLKVEEPDRGDYVRWMPPYTTSGESGAHLALNRGKRSITCDLRTEGGRGVLRDLAHISDVLVESFRPGVLDRLGVGYDALRAVNPRLVHVAISAYGSDGPYAGRAGHDINCLAYAGVLSFTGHPSVGPVVPGVQVADVGAGLHAAVAALAALRVREVTGEGQFCDVSMSDATLSMLVAAAGTVAASGKPPRLGEMSLAGGLACYGTYRCSDGRHVAVGALEPRFFAELCSALGAAELADWQYDEDRQAKLRERLAAIFATRPRDEWVALLADRDACVAPVNDMTEAFGDPNARARGMVEEVSLADGSSYPRIGVSPRLTGTPGRPGGPPSALGADTDAVLAELGRTRGEVTALRAEGAI